MIYPSRIKGEEYPLMKGDIVVCITKHFDDFTYGKQYKLYSELTSPSLLPIESDRGHYPTCAKSRSGWSSYYSPTGYYFLPLHIWRELKINKLLEIR